MIRIYLLLSVIFFTGCSVNTNNTGTTNTADVKIIRVEPRFPKRALRKKIYKGSVKLGFDVDEQGKTTNIHIIDSIPKVVFDKSAVRALSQWTYYPKIVDGSPVVRKGLWVRLDYSSSK